MSRRREANTQDLNGSLNFSLGKLGSLDTLQTGLDEIKAYLLENRKAEDKLTHFLASLSPNNENMLSISHKKEYIRLYGTMAEVLEADAAPFLPKIFAALQKKLKEANPNLNDAISQSYGSIIHNTLHTLPDLPSSCTQLISILKPLFEGLSSSNRLLQIGSGMCVNRVIQHSPLECLRFLLDKLAGRLLQLLNTSRAQCQIVEAIISLVLSVEQDFSPYAARTVPEVLNCITSEDATCRKQAVDALYTLGAVVPQPVAPFAREVMTVLNRARTDKAKPVRDSAVEAFALYKKIAPEPQARAKVEVRSPREENKPTSIFKGPVNANFFKAANNDSVVEAPERPSVAREFYYEEEYESPVFKEREEEIEKFEFEEPAYRKSGGREEVEERKENVAGQVELLRNEFSQFREQVKMEMSQVNQRLGALEEMITTISQLFDAKIKQITCNPNIANLLRH
jgi:hypothetical protein